VAANCKGNTGFTNSLRLDGVSPCHANLFVAPRAPRPLLLPRMFRFRFSPLAALAGLILVFTSCERHPVGQWPELQKEHLHPLDPGEDVQSVAPKAAMSPTPADFFPNQKP